MRKIYCVGGDNEYANWMQGEMVSLMEEADLVLFTGGSDVDSSLYNEPAHPYASSNIRRDIYEKREFLKARELNKPIASICRGLQFVTIMAGGRLVQHTGSPGFIHPVKLWDGRVLLGSSCHHQSAYPFQMPTENFKILGWTENLCGYHEDGNQQEMNPPVECEIVWYPKINAIGWQMHPEFDVIRNHPDIKVYQELLNRFMEGKL